MFILIGIYIFILLLAIILKNVEFFYERQVIFCFCTGRHILNIHFLSNKNFNFYSCCRKNNASYFNFAFSPSPLINQYLIKGNFFILLVDCFVPFHNSSNKPLLCFFALYIYHKMQKYEAEIFI